MPSQIISCTLRMIRENDIRSSCTNALRQICERKVQKLFEIWTTVGHPNLEAKVDVVCNNVEQLFNEIIQDETEYQGNLAAQIEELLEEAADLSQEVNADHVSIIAGLEDTAIPLLRLQEILNERLQEYRICKQLRLHRYQELLQEEEELCTSLGIKKRPMLNKVPKEEELEELSYYISQKFEEEKVLRRQFDETKRKVEVISSELGISPNRAVHKKLVSSPQFSCSNENMMVMKELHQVMEQKLEKAKSESIVIRETLSSLWDCLHIDYSEREEILQKYPGHSIMSIDALKREIQKYEQQKIKNIRKFVETSRIELVDLWDKCCFGQLQRQQFHSHYYSDCFTEDLLEIHEEEIKRLKTYFFENIDILELAKRREKLWQKMIELEERVHDPKRFTNRGGRLLREEKDRTAIQKDLPALDRELTALLDAYEKKHNVSFLYNGTILREYIKSKWETFQKRKKEEKLAREKSKEKTQADKALSASKRKTPNTPATVPRKVNKTENRPIECFSERASCNSERNIIRRIFGKREKKSVTTRTKTLKAAGDALPEAFHTDFQKLVNATSGNPGNKRGISEQRQPLREKNNRTELPGNKRVETPAVAPRTNFATRSSANLPANCTPQSLQKRNTLSKKQSALRPRRHTPIII